MTKEDFIACMHMLNAYYLNWQFNFQDKIQVETWYQIINDAMDFTMLKRVINIWTARNDTGPNSPRDLRKIQIELELKDMINNGEPNSEGEL